VLQDSVGTSRLIVPLMLLAGWTQAPAAAQTAADTAGGQAPNILLIQADDLGYGDLSAYGQARFQTPSLDRLAREGIRFTQYYAGSPVCAPSRAALMTGRHTGHGWIRGHGDVPLRPRDTTLAQVLHAVGYRTAVIGKWGLGRPGSSGAPERKGFEYSFGFLDHNHAHRQYTDHLWRNGRRIATDPEQDYVNDLFTRETAGFIERRDRRPFFIYLNYTVPHAELRAPEDAVRPFVGRFPEQPFVNPRADARATGADETSLGFRSQPLPHATFAAMITRMDRDIGRLVDLLDSLGVGRRTLVLFVSDNGPHHAGGGDPAFFWSAGELRGGKGTLYEGGIRVPMIARWTGTIPAGLVSDHVWAHWDLLPTLAELAGASVPAGLDGVSGFRALRGQRQPAQPFLYWEYDGRGFQQAARMGQWKAVRPDPTRPLELYDLAHDPRERQNLAASRPEILSRIEGYLDTARTESSRWPKPTLLQAWARRIPRPALLILALTGVVTAGYLGGRALARRRKKA
jgi:arylsulfatase A